MIKLLLSILLSFLGHIFYHTIPIFNYIDLMLIAVVLYLDYTDRDLFFYIIPISLYNDYFLNINFGISAILFFGVYLLRIVVSRNMFFKSHFLKFLYYITTVLAYNLLISLLLGITLESCLISIPVRVFLDIAIIYLVNTIMESKFVVSYGK